MDSSYRLSEEGSNTEHFDFATALCLCGEGNSVRHDHLIDLTLGKAGERCGVCDATITRLRQGRLNRSTYLCPRCQPAPSDAARSKPSSLLREY